MKKEIVYKHAKYLVALLVNLLLLGLAVSSLLVTCMWGCPNSGIQLVFKVSTICLFLSSISIIYLWVTAKNASQ